VFESYKPFNGQGGSRLLLLTVHCIAHCGIALIIARIALAISTITRAISTITRTIACSALTIAVIALPIAVIVRTMAALRALFHLLRLSNFNADNKKKKSWH